MIEVYRKDLGLYPIAIVDYDSTGCFDAAVASFCAKKRGSDEKGVRDNWV